MSTSKSQLEVVTHFPTRTLQHRENRIEVPDSIHFTVKVTMVDGETSVGKLLNVSKFGVSISCAGVKLSKDEIVPSLNISFENQSIYSGPARIISERMLDGIVAYGLLLHDQLEVDRVLAVLEYKKIGGYPEKKKNIVNSFDAINDQFKILVADLHTLLQGIKEELSEEHKEILSMSRSDSHRSRLEEQAINLAISIYTEQIREIFSRFQKIISNFTEEEHQIHKRYFRCNFHPLTINAPFINRAFTKPLGYAGDFGLMMMFYDYADEGKTLFDKFFHRFSCNEPSAIANKNRIFLLADLIVDFFHQRKKKENFKLASIASGPGMEISMAIEEIQGELSEKSGSVECILIDQERLALDKATENIRNKVHAANFRLKTFCEDAVLGFIKKRKFTEEFVNSDQIISAGLFDYLSDRVATKLIESLYACLRPGGELIIGNVSSENPDRFSMMYFMEWILVLRSENDLINLVPDNIRAVADVHVKKESLGLNLFLVIRKNE